ncbi:sulfite exporter TauE/SafE family protein [Shewanella livingstonensis]|uniref:Probable membrane transporter protein n=1 Tax=Shewanella livingstonensis TaxID=150120 RepID=A0A3G8LXC2_9GAMM|nr:sulfite exporter TauE/SafE family protein [Shewanella livingstonensis]AZG73370.1 sulfite exporter TauE/SafE family protein [Shewanella livingstonensis]
MIPAIIGALLIGLVLSVLGSGGSILTVPVLLYLIGMQPELAIASSLCIVGVISLLSSIRFIKHKKVSWPHVLLFGLPGMLGTYLGAWTSTFSTSNIQLTVFVILMLIGAVMMWRNQSSRCKAGKLNISKILLQGLAVGVVTGFVGVGGGFLIVPALVLLGGIEMRLAIGTSLLIITMNSLVGFVKYYSLLSDKGFEFNWSVIGIMIAGGIVGSMAGQWINQYLPKPMLQKLFAVFLGVMALFILSKSII